MIDLTSLTNALTDATVNVQERDLRKLGVKKGSYSGLNNVNCKELFKIISGKKPRYCQAGSSANVIFNSSLLGLETCLLGTVGCDDVGERYIEKLKEEGIASLVNKSKGQSGIAYILVTPDGERTSVVDMGVAGEFNFNLDDIKETRMFHTSGYETVTNPEATEELINYIRNKGARISFDLSDVKVIRDGRKTIERIVEKAHILFVTEEEGRELAGESPIKSLKELSKICPVVSLKRGQRGSIVREGNQQKIIKAYPTKIVNTCGAGDAYAAGFLFAYLRGFSLEDCGCTGSYIASRVCSLQESHLLRRKDTCTASPQYLNSVKATICYGK